MLSKNFKNKAFIVFPFLLIGVCIWFLNYITPESTDDYVYKYVFNREIQGVDITRPVKSFFDIIVSQYNHYFTTNGRIFPHVIVQTFTGIIGKDCFNIFNSLVFCLFIFLMTKLVNYNVTPLNLFFISVVILFLFPSFKETVLWMTGSVNYLWPSTGVCLFLLLLIKYRNKPLSPFIWILSLVSFYISCSHEGLSMPLAVSLIIYYFFNRKYISSSGNILILSFIAGAFICSFSPATMTRAAITEGALLSVVVTKIQALIIVGLDLRAFWVLMLVLLFNLIVYKNKKILFVKWFYINNMIEWNTIFLAFGIVFISGFDTVRAAIGVELFSIILLLRLIKKYLEKYSFYLKYLGCGCGLALYGLICKYSIPNYLADKDMLRQLKSSSQTFIINREPKIPDFLSSYILSPIFISQFRTDNYYNELIAATYDKSKIAFIPESIKEAIINNDTILNNTSYQKKFPFYILPLKKEFKMPYKAIYELRLPNSSEIPFYLKPVASKMERYSAKELEIEPEVTEIIEYSNRKYILIPKNPVVDYRMTGVKFSY